MGIFLSLFAVAVLVFLALAGAEVGLDSVFGIVIPYAAFIVFVFGVFNRILGWAGAPVPFRITATCGQQKSLPWIKQSRFDNPSGFFGVVVRMFLEVCFFRSLFRNTKAEMREGPAAISAVPRPAITYGGEKILWLAALAFHWSFLIILLRHFRFFIEPMPAWLCFVQNVDGIFQLAVPVFYLTNAFILAGLGFILLRRVFDSRIRYISLPADYFALYLILGVVVSGIMMRYCYKVDVVEVKKLAMGLVTLSPYVPEGNFSVFYVHIFLVSVLLAYFPFSKLMHMGGVFLSPTRNLANSNRMRRHINPWNPDVKVHTYVEYEEDFRDVMKAAGLPLEKE